MGDYVKCFDIEELECLDERQIKLLKEAIHRELGNSPEIRRILREKLQPVYDRMATPKDP